MAHVIVIQGEPSWVPVIASDVNTGGARLGILDSQVDVVFKKNTQAAFQVKTIDVNNWRENGLGVYEILFLAGDLDITGSFLYVVTNNGTLPAPAIRQFIGQANVEESLAYVEGQVSFDSNILTGNLVDGRGAPLVDAAISARIVELPTVLGLPDSRAGVGLDLISARTNSAGFFALEVIQGSLIDVVIPIVGYRRTLRVPNNATNKLFELA